MMGGGQDTQVDRLRGMIGDKQEETIEILHGLRPKYEEHHHAKFLDEALKAAAELSQKARPKK